jgi:endogenous inhibitor of DNA gyrase (YacG/DUF329 family)
VDLGRWFTGEYRVPGDPAAPEPQEEKREDGDRDKS